MKEKIAQPNIINEAYNAGIATGSMATASHILEEIEKLDTNCLVSDKAYSWQQGYHKAIIDLQIIISQGGLY